MKKWIITLSFCIAVTLAACGQKNVEKEGTVQNQTAAAEGVTELTFWHSLSDYYGEVLTRQINRFNETIGKEKNIHVTDVYQGWPGTEALTAGMASESVDNLPDVMMLYTPYLNLVRDYDRLAWVEDYITREDATVKKEDLIANAAKSFVMDGRMIGVPYNLSAILLYYNKDYLEAAGYQAPPKTIAEMAQMLPVIVEKTDAEYGLNVHVESYEFESWIVSQGADGAEYGNNSNGRDGHLTELVCQTEMKNFLDEWKKVIDSKSYKYVKGSYNEEFANGLNAMMIRSCSHIPTVDRLVDGAFEWGVSQIPVVNAGDSGGAIPSGGGLFMFDRDDDVRLEAAWEFVQYMISAEAQTMWMETTGYVPVNIHAQELDAYKQYVEAEPRLSTAVEILTNSPEKITVSFSPNTSEMDNVIKETMELMAEGSLSVEETYQTLMEGISGVFEDYYRANPID